MQWRTHEANTSTASMVLPPFLTVILFVAMLSTIKALPLRYKVKSKQL
jgi:hypothetical protein